MTNSTSDERERRKTLLKAILLAILCGSIVGGYLWFLDGSIDWMLEGWR